MLGNAARYRRKTTEVFEWDLTGIAYAFHWSDNCLGCSRFAGCRFRLQFVSYCRKVISAGYPSSTVSGTLPQWSCRWTTRLWATTCMYWLHPTTDSFRGSTSFRTVLNSWCRKIVWLAAATMSIACQKLLARKVCRDPAADIGEYNNHTPRLHFWGRTEKWYGWWKAHSFLWRVTRKVRVYDRIPWHRIGEFPFHNVQRVSQPLQQNSSFR